MSSSSQIARPCVAATSIPATDIEIVDRDVRQIQTQRLPTRAIVERHIHGLVRAGKDQARPSRIGNRHTHWLAGDASTSRCGLYRMLARLEVCDLGNR